MLECFTAGYHKVQMGRPPGKFKGVKNSRLRKPYRKNLLTDPLGVKCRSSPLLSRDKELTKGFSVDGW